MDDLRAATLGGEPTDAIAQLIAKDDRLRPEDKTWIQNFFNKLEVTTITELRDINSIQPVKEYVFENLQEYNTACSRPASGPVLAAVGRIIKATGAEAASAGGSISSTDAALASLEAQGNAQKLALAGMLAGQGTPEALEKAMLSKKVNIRQLIDGAKYGEPAPGSWSIPSDEDLKKFSLAADLGYAAPPHLCGFPDYKQENDYFLADLVLAWGRYAHASLLQWRHDPATVINMMTQTAKIASDRSLGNAGKAARIASVYYSNCREQNFEWSRSNPETADNTKDFLGKMGQVYMKREETCYNNAVGLVGLGNVRLSPRQPQGNSNSNHCIWNSFSKCTRRCKFQHECAFCNGSTPGCPNSNGGWLTWHFERLQNPMKLISNKQQKGEGRGRWGTSYRDNRPRSRSPRRRNHTDKGDDDEANDHRHTGSKRI